MKTVNMIATSVAGVMGVFLAGQIPVPATNSIQNQQKKTDQNTSTYEESQISFEWNVETSLKKEELDRFSFTYEKTFFKYDDCAYLRLNSPLTMALLRGKLSIKEWIAEIKCSGFDDIDKSIIRFFQDTYQNIADDTASPQQKEQWSCMIKTFDYKFFSQGVAPAIYVEGVINSIKNGKVFITWDNGVRDICDTNLAVGFTNGRFLVDDRIGAFVKWDGYHTLNAIYDTRRLPQNDCENYSIDDIPALPNA